MPACFHCSRESDAAHYDRVVYNKMHLHGPWAGWRMAGRYLVSPDRDRISPERLRGLLWAEHLRPRAVGRCADRTSTDFRANVIALLPPPSRQEQR